MPTLNDENKLIVDWLLLWPMPRRQWGVGWNHKCMYRIYREFGDRMRIEPRKLSSRKKPDALSGPEALNPYLGGPTQLLS